MVRAPDQDSPHQESWMNQVPAWTRAAAAWSEPKSSAVGADSASMFEQQQQQQQPVAVLHQQGVQSSPTTAQKEQMKLRKKLREIQKIERLVGAGETVDRLQLDKMKRKDELIVELGRMEQMNNGKMHGKPEEQQLTESLEVTTEDQGRQQTVQIWNSAACHDTQPQLRSQHPQQLQQQQQQQPQQQQKAEYKKSATVSRRQRRQRRERKDSEAKANLAPPQEPATDHRTASASAAGRDCTLLDRLQGDAVERGEALNALRGSVVKQAFSAGGCRALQQAFEVANLETVSLLVAELHGHVRLAAESPHANYVIQKIVTECKPSLSSFVVHELRGVAAQLARHRYGCRIFCRLVEHSVGGEDFAQLMHELLLDALGLSRHQFGHYVMQSILEHGSEEHRKQLVAAICNDIRHSAQHRWASHVVETALSYCSVEEQHSIAASIGYWDADGMVALSLTEYGSFVMKALIRVPGEPGGLVWAHIQHARAKLDASRYGQRVLESGAQGFRAA